MTVSKGSGTVEKLKTDQGLQSSAASIFALTAKKGLKFEDVECPELGEGHKIRVRELTGTEREHFEKRITTISSTTQGTSNGRKLNGQGNLV